MTKKALLIGINYPRTDSELRGCANDCLTSMKILKNRFGFRSSNIKFLTDAKEYPGYEKPTVRNIRKWIKWLVRGAKSGDSLFFHYSGHGSWVRDKDGDEVDGRDECICPCDYERKGFIIDDELFDTLIKPLPAGCKLFSIMDCCHSGTMFDLKYTFAPEETGAKQLTQTGNKECDANVIMVSGCRDNQTSADAHIGGQYAGAMTTSFAHTMRNWFKVHKSYPAYSKLLSLMFQYMKKHRYSQRPQINCSHQIDLKKVLDI